MAITTLQPGAAPANPSRRSIIGGLAIAPLVAAAPASAELQSSLEQELDRLIDWKGRLDMWNLDEAGADRLSDAASAAYRQVEALPVSPGNVMVRAKALTLLFMSDPRDLHDMDDTTDNCLVKLMARDVLAGRAN
ncbi:hypothetical protein SAMN05444678_11687 [Sphingomonas sp. YR710]|uniref:hypothetical protein n=1 Tax=Sphingomonas sp. YR710 TaxID=1882773 RepID=UPI000883F407|nr:hypothetical protein [Sphingomonas sp. YR710]SDD58604.1 hypothetical protein SAMN05444678_11687 [Sphingomonas sp. YR710]